MVPARRNGLTRIAGAVVLTVVVVLSGCMAETSVPSTGEGHSRPRQEANVDFVLLGFFGTLLDAVFNRCDYSDDDAFHYEASRFEYSPEVWP